MTYVVDTAPERVAELAGQAIDALVAIKELTDTTRAAAPAPAVEAPVAGQAGTHPAPLAPADPPALTAALAGQEHLLRSALVVGRSATAGRATKLERKYNNLFTRMINRWDDYLRFAHDRFTTKPRVATADRA